MAQPQLSPGARAALEALNNQGRVRVADNLHRLWMIELKGFDLAEEAFEDVWQLKAKRTLGRGILS